MNKTFGVHKQGTFSLSKDQTLAGVLQDVPPEILTGCDIEEACRPDYKQAIFSQDSPEIMWLSSQQSQYSTRRKL